jgi:hypothetical protein
MYLILSGHRIADSWQEFIFFMRKRICCIDTFMKNPLLLGQAASALGVKPYQIIYLLTTSQVPEPRRVGGRRMFGDLDLQRIAEALGVAVPSRHRGPREVK